MLRVQSERIAEATSGVRGSSEGIALTTEIIDATKGVFSSGFQVMRSTQEDLRNGDSNQLLRKGHGNIEDVAESETNVTPQALFTPSLVW
jgi:hypothetical protein